MKSWPVKGVLLAGAAVLLAAIPASGQDRAPESLLPPGFGDPQTLPPAENKAAPQPRNDARPQPSEAAPPPAPSAVPAEDAQLTGNAIGDVEQVALDQAVIVRPLNYFTVPEGAERPVDPVGPLEPGNFGLAPDAFGAGNGFVHARLMRQLDAPLPSRWASILLRRALLSRLSAPAGVDPVDWVAERADLLVRMGEADAARMLIEAVDVEHYTPRMVEAAGQTALATSDPAALCPLLGAARRWSTDRIWILADGMCAALEGEAARASALIDQARGQGGTSVDVLLAEKVVGAGAETRRSVDIQWDGVDRVTPWRFGLASATGLTIPDPLMARATPQIQAWLARAPMVPIENRLRAASVAATLGVFSSHSLVELYSLILDRTDPADAAGTVGMRLRTAWIAGDIGERMEALRSLWTDGEAPQERYARLILTAGAAARIAPSSDYQGDAGNLIAAMLSAGMDREAARWAPVVEEAGEGGRAWAMLAVAAPEGAVADRLADFVDADASAGQLRSRMLAAALAGLGRISADQASGAGFAPGPEDIWTRAIDRAARDRAPGAVALLAGVGMQTQDWTGVPPAYLFRMLRALRAVGLDYEARMIAAEALARL
jgi:hypothetical protein